jgi:hypothetical protein
MKNEYDPFGAVLSGQKGGRPLIIRLDHPEESKE